MLKTTRLGACYILGIPGKKFVGYFWGLEPLVGLMGQGVIGAYELDACVKVSLTCSSRT